MKKANLNGLAFFFQAKAARICVRRVDSRYDFTILRALLRKAKNESLTLARSAHSASRTQRTDKPVVNRLAVDILV